ncbi:MAG TPA: AMP-binding protein [Methanomassiliicoccales archaeon]|jgi:long-chain acyl-CoA synthetase
MNAVLLTGGTGFIGTYVARWLIMNTERPIIVLVRAENDEEAKNRLSRAWWDRQELIQALDDRVRVIAGDVTVEGLGLAADSYERVIAEVGTIIHAAADIRLNAPLEDLRRTNVEGVRNVLRLADDVQGHHGLERFSHISTAYVAGARKGVIPEEDLTDRYGFLSNYEISKFEGERLVRAAKHLPVSIFRPGMVVGSSEDGHVRTFNTLYYPLRLYLTGKLKVVPLSASQKVNLVPVDYIAEAIGRLTLDRRAEGRTFHLVGVLDALPTVKEAIIFTRTWAKERLGVELPRPVFVPMAGLMGRASEDLKVIAPYLQERRAFRRDNVDELMGVYSIDWHHLLPRLLEFGTYNGFLHRSERTVHEQVLFRLKSKRRPVRLFDIVDGSVVSRPAEEVRGEMLMASAALRSLGIVPGDRVAIVGSNSIRYLVLDVAIGLVGGVSVPLYYTSPPKELSELVGSSRAKIVLIGSEAVLKRFGEMSVAVPAVSFCGSVPEELADRVMKWEDFLELGGEAADRSPAGFGDLATLRYTSSTTGKAKGVLFKHEHLRYMAESTASLPPWEARNSEVFYLSFLPMNHVVEGILATYSPFYAPAPINLYFLKDFGGLKAALLKVRPTVFFSVPRFYEKMWDTLLANPRAKRYLEGAGGISGLIMAPIIRRRALRSAGLDRCAYLISGSGRMSTDILTGLHKLDIEVHNAYGLTEAPLVTINYPGRNRFGTVGEPLPSTEVKIAADGEVLVKGPQVTCGYLGDVEQPFRDGHLLTGDIGHLTPEGGLVLEGRKKELIKTSYGKFVNPLNAETRLRDLPGVFEAMIVGEGRPYCSALVWPEKGVTLEIDALVGGMNTDLSHPEQVKAWAVLSNDLSVEGGELTANMKLRRSRVMERFAPVIEAIYSGSTVPGEAIHIGRAERGP